MTRHPSANPPHASRGVHPIELDLRGLRCPMPVLRTRKALCGLAPGDCLHVLCTDPLAGLDIPHLLHETGDLLVAQSRDDGIDRFTIRKR